MFALVDRESGRKEELEQFLHKSFGAAGIEADTLWLVPDSEGPQLTLLTPESPSGTFIENIKELR
ncbi:hypothetical protein D3C75_1204960 [compost metagenome]